MGTPLFDWAATLSGFVFIAFVASAGFVTAWNDPRGRAHRVPFLVLTCFLALAVAVAGLGMVIKARPYPVGDSRVAQAIALGIIALAVTLLWHGFGTIINGFKPRRNGPPDADEGAAGLPSAVLKVPVGSGSSAREIPRLD